MGSISPLVIAGTFVIALGELLHIVGVATDYWIVWKDGTLGLNLDAYAGLWNYCLSSTCEDLDSQTLIWDEISSDVEAVRALVLIGLLCCLAGIVVAVIMIVLPLIGKTAPSVASFVCLGTTIAAFIFIVIGVIVFGTNVHGDTLLEDFTDLDYSFALCIVGGILMPIGGGLVLFGGMSSSSSSVTHGPGA